MSVMKKSVFLPIIVLSMVMFPIALVAQPHYAKVLKDLEANNLTLLAAAKQAEAQQAAAHAGLLLDDPDVEAAYYWGDPADMGIRWDISVSQSFQMPSVLVRRARLRNLQENAAHLDYQALRYSTLLETQQLCADLIYYRNMVAIYNRRHAAAVRLAELYRRRYETGDCSILDYNRAQMNLADMQSRYTQAELDADHAVRDLSLLMNVEHYSFTQMEYDSVWVEPSFDMWYQQYEKRNPQLRQLDNQLAISQQEEQLSRAQWLPQFSVGYAAENVVGSTWRGATLGVTLPLWSQQRAVRSAKLHTAATQAALQAKRAELAAEFLSLHHRHAALILDLQRLKSAFRQSNSVALLEKALTAGEITLEQYLQQVNYYSEIEIEIWSTARQLEQLHLLLYAVEL